MTRHLDAAAIDDALDLFALLMATRLINPARAASNTERLASLPRLERASRTLALAHRALLAALDGADAEDLAAMTGITTESVSSTLSKLRRRGLIDTGRRWTAVTDPAGLADFAHG